MHVWNWDEKFHIYKSLMCKKYLSDKLKKKMLLKLPLIDSVHDTYHPLFMFYH